MSDNKEQKMVEIGAFWRRTSQKGKKYLNGSIDPQSIPESFNEKIKVVMFPNGSKEKDTQPDFYLYLSNTPSPVKQVAVACEEESETEEGLL